MKPDHSQAQLSINHDQRLVQNLTIYTSVGVGALGGILAFLCSKVIFKTDQVSLFTTPAIGSMVILYSLVVLIGIYLAYIGKSKIRSYLPGRTWFDGAMFTGLALFLPYFVLFGFLLLRLANLLDASFVGLTLHWFMGVLFACALSATVAYFATRFVLTLEPLGVTRLFSVFMVYGIFTAILKSDNKEWWAKSVSYLGFDTGSANLFEMTMVVGGLMVMLVGRFIVYRLRHLGEVSTLSDRCLTWGTLILGLSIILIGVFPVGPDRLADTIHNFAARALGVLCIAGMMGTRWYLRFLPNSFHVISVIFGISIIVMAVMHYATGLVAFSIMELIVFGIAGAWLYLLVEAMEGVESATGAVAKHEAVAH